MESTWTMYHNPNCSKCRQTLEILTKKGIHPNLIDYLKAGIDQKTIENIILASNKNPDSFLRKKEKEFSIYSDITTNTAKSVAAIVSKCPQLLERPVVIRDNKVVIARPAELVEELF